MRRCTTEDQPKKSSTIFTARRSTKWPSTLSLGKTLKKPKQMSANDRESKDWERQIYALMEKEDYKGVVERYNNYMTLGRPFAKQNHFKIYDDERLEEMTSTARERYHRSLELFKLGNIVPSFACIQQVVKAHVLLGNLNTACEVFKSGMYRFAPKLKSVQYVAHARDFLLLLISQQTALHETRFLVDLLTFFRIGLRRYYHEGSIRDDAFPRLFRRPIEAAIASRDFGTAARLILELNRCPCEMPSSIITSYADARVKDLHQADNEHIIYELVSVLSTRADDPTILEIAVKHLPDPHLLQFQTKHTFSNPSASTSDINLDDEFKQISKLVWNENPLHNATNVKVNPIPEPKL